MDIQKPNKRAIAVFVLMIPLLTELLSGNTSITQFINPITFLFFIVSYSFPALVLRELFIKWRLSLVGLFILGLAYGIFNEGVAARTILLTGNAMFMPVFRNFSTVGFNLPWASFILPWHAFFSVTYPILLIHTIYPAEVSRSWLSKKMMWLLGGFAAVLGSVAYFSTAKYPATPTIDLLLCWIFIGLLIFSARRFSGQTQLASQGNDMLSRKKIVGIAILITAVQLLSFIWSSMRLPIFVQVLFVSLPYFYLFFYLHKKETISTSILSRIGVAHYAAWTLLMTIIVSTGGNPIVLIGAVIVWMLLFMLWKNIHKASLF